jgi:S-adenosylmethionine:tRNA ribosyltransferase-isomerase
LYLRIQDFDYELPRDRIAIAPAPIRDAARLLALHVPTGNVHHASFHDLPRLLAPGSLLVLNDTRVIPARLIAKKSTGGRAEILLIRRVDGANTGHINHSEGVWKEMWEVLLRGMGSALPGACLSIDGDVRVTLVSRPERGATCVTIQGSAPGGVLALADAQGSVPLPPYIESARRAETATDDVDDRTRYQTVFARVPGAIAAPTAGLHFTEQLLVELRAAGHELAWVTLHVGPGTFRPVEVDDPAAHQMDPEWYVVPTETAIAVNRARQQGRPVVAVGTTVVRTLESVASGGRVEAGQGATRLFVLPGFPFQVVTDLVTNFHLPRSTLLMLVAAFAGREPVMRAYQEAITAGYRFYSYGDAMFISGGGATPPLAATSSSASGSELP